MDVALEYDSASGTFDLALEAADLKLDDGLRPAVIVSLFSDARAAADARLPAEATDRRGYWGDAFAEIAGDLFGSDLWLVDREKNLEATRARLEEAARRGLAWIVTDGVGSSVRALAELFEDDVAALEVRVYEPTGTWIEFRFSYVWEAV